jgi:hypothetical protein
VERVSAIGASNSAAPWQDEEDEGVVTDMASHAASSVADIAAVVNELRNEVRTVFLNHLLGS